MNTITLLTWIAGYIALATILFNLLRFFMKVNLTSTIIISVTLTFLTCRLFATDSMSPFLSEYIHALIVLGAVMGIIIAIAKSSKNSESEDNANIQ